MHFPSLYLCGGGVEREAEQRAEAQSRSHRQGHQQHPCQAHGPLGLGTVPPQHGHTSVGQLERGGTSTISSVLFHSQATVDSLEAIIMLTMRRYPPATRITLTSEKDFMMSLRVVVEKAWRDWLELSGILWWTT